MQAAPNYTFTGTVDVGSGQAKLAGRFQAPDRVLEIVTAASGAAAELVMIGPAVFVHDPATGKWRRSLTTSGTTDPRSAFSVLLDAEDVSRSAGQFQFSLPPRDASGLLAGTAAAGSVAGTADLVDGVITSLRVVLPLASRQVVVSIDYSSVGTAPPVATPTIG